MSVAVVADRGPEETAARLAAARDRARQGQGVLLVALPSLLPEERARWATQAECTRASMGARCSAAALAFEALRAAAPLDEARFSAADGLGQVACAEARTGGQRVAARLIIELGAEDAALAQPLPLGASVDERLEQEAARLALRDADAVEGDAAARDALLAAGWELARPAAPPAWDTASAPPITAVVSFYNLGRWLPECLASLRAQTVPLEIVVVDDGSSPAEAQVLAAEAAREPRIRVIRQENRGPSSARNRGIAEASHDLILIVDADNVARPRLAERLREALRLRPDAAFACPAFRGFRERTGETSVLYGPSEGSEDALFVRNVRGDACALYTRRALTQPAAFEEQAPVNEDWLHWVAAADAGLMGVAVPELLFDYRERDDSRLRSASPLSMAHARLELQRRFPRLLALHAGSVSRLLARELVINGEDQRQLGRNERDAGLAALQSALAAERTSAEAARAGAEEMRAELRKAQERAAQLQAQLEQAERDLARGNAERASLAAQRDEGLQQLRAAREQARFLDEALAGARAHAAEAHAAAEELSRSSAVRAARLLHRASPLLHGAVGKASQALLGLLPGSK